MCSNRLPKRCLSGGEGMQEERKEREREKGKVSGVCGDRREGGHGGRKRQVNRMGRVRGGGPEKKEVGRRSQEERERAKEEKRVGGRRKGGVGGERGRGRNRRGGGEKGGGGGQKAGEEGRAGGVCAPADDVGDGGGVLGLVSESSERGTACSQGAQLIEGLVVV